MNRHDDPEWTIPTLMVLVYFFPVRLQPKLRPIPDGNLTWFTLKPKLMNRQKNEGEEKMPRLLGFLVVTSLLSWNAVAAPLLVNGAGATFPAPLYAKWIAEYRSIDASAEINYQSIGSGGYASSSREPLTLAPPMTR